MKNITKIVFLIGLFALAAFAQIKPKTKTAAKPADAKSANTKTTSAKPADKKPADKKAANAKSKTAPNEKTTSEKSKSVKNQAAKPQTAKEKAAKTSDRKVKTVQAKTEKNKPEKNKTEKTKAAKSQTAKDKAVKSETVKTQTVKSQLPVKIAVKTNTKLATKSGVKPPIKTAPRETVTPANRQTTIESIAKPPAETAIAAAAAPNFDGGDVIGKTYYNKTFNFAFTLPDEWEIADDDFAERLKKEGFNLNIEMPKAAADRTQSKLNAAIERVKILLTAYKASTETNQNAILRVSIEDLRDVPQVKDAVDYFDLMRSTYRNVKLPANFKYSETQAEKLGAMQFGFLDVANGAGKKRMYATVRDGYAVMFTLTYNSDGDLAAFKNLLADGDFRRK